MYSPSCQMNSAGELEEETTISFVSAKSLDSDSTINISNLRVFGANPEEKDSIIEILAFPQDQPLSRMVALSILILPELASEIFTDDAWQQLQETLAQLICFAKYHCPEALEYVHTGNALPNNVNRALLYISLNYRMIGMFCNILDPRTPGVTYSRQYLEAVDDLFDSFLLLFLLRPEMVQLDQTTDQRSPMDLQLPTLKIIGLPSFLGDLC